MDDNFEDFTVEYVDNDDSDIENYRVDLSGIFDDEPNEPLDSFSDAKSNIDWEGDFDSNKSDNNAVEDDFNEEIDVQDEKKAKRRFRKRKSIAKENRRWVKKNKNYLWFKVARKKYEWHPAIYYPLCVLTVGIDIIRNVFKFFCFVFCGLVTLGIVGGVLFAVLAKPTYDNYSDFAKQTVYESSYDTFRIAESSIIYDDQYNVIANLHETADTEYLTYNEIPEEVVNAFIAIEDRTFWTNLGIDFKGIVRVLYGAFRSEGDDVHGASTITQQVARNIFLTHSVSIERKVKEMLIAMYMTEKYTKQDIMEFYCNDICFGNGIYGIQGAAKAYFGKDVRQLSLKQKAYLCALPNRPSYYNPYNDETRAVKRSNKILKDMHECGFITQKELNQAILEPIRIEKKKYEFNDYESSYAIDCAIKFLMQLDGFRFKYTFTDMREYHVYKEAYNSEYEQMRHNLYTGGYKIYTTLNKDTCEKMQAALDKRLSFNTEVDEESGLYTLQGAATCIDNATGKVVGIVGGRTQESESANNIYTLNRGYQSYRQPGSSFKPIAVYTPALEQGYTADTIVENIDVTKAKEDGANVQKLHGASMPLRNAVEKSLNGVAWKVFDKITPAYGLSFINEMQFSKICPNDFYDASALGGLTYGVTTVEMAGGYCALANHGEWIEPTCIQTFVMRDGTRYTPELKKQVYTARAADNMVDILQGVLIRGTAAGLGWSGSTKMDAFGKTGTTNDSKDGWFCGATPYYTMSVWVGYDMPKTLSNLYGATYPGQIWKDAMLGIIDGLEPKQFERLLDDESYQKELPKVENSVDYSEDKNIGANVNAVINNMNMVDPLTQGPLLDAYYTQASSLLPSIQSNKYRNELQTQLDTMYATKKQLQMLVPQVDVNAIPQIVPAQ